MNKILNYIFYKYYKWQIFVRDGDPAGAAVTSMVFLMSVVILETVIYCKLFFGFDLLGITYKFHNIYSVVLIVILFLINHRMFISRNRYKAIIKKYNKESERERIIGNIIVGSFTILSFLLLVVAFIMMP